MFWGNLIITILYGICRDYGFWLSTESLSWNFEALYYSGRCTLTIFIQGKGISMHMCLPVKQYFLQTEIMLLFFFYFISFKLVSLLSLQPKDKPVPNATLQVTGAVGWRREGLSYKKNEVRIDFIFWLCMSVVRFCESADIMHSHWCRCFWILWKV